jgi:hypothetical protein
MFDVKNHPEKLTIYVRASGLVRLDEMQVASGVLKAAVDSYGGRSHLVLADMRGMLPAPPEVAVIMGEAIGYSRHHGTVLCVHLSDSAIVRLQAARLVRECNPLDTATVDVVSLEEAEIALEEERRHIAERSQSGVLTRIESGRGGPKAMNSD